MYTIDGDCVRLGPSTSPSAPMFSARKCWAGRWKSVMCQPIPDWRPVGWPEPRFDPDV